MIVFFFKQKTAYEMRISDWSSDVCSSDRQTAARFCRDRVVGHHSYVIGGNSEREHFGPPDRIAPFITERTCEACNSYNMLKLTRHVYGWAPDAALFDYYERVHLNHILAHQHPDSGMFAYFMPLSAGARRRSEEHTSELQSLMPTPTAVIRLKKK